ncbi:MAG: hypothetical protein ABI992_09370, partial [Chthoniobacterales bacterium]
HDQVAGESLRGLINRLADLCEPILIAGNHDRRLPKTFDFVTAWETDGFRFHHGHCAAGVDARIQIIGHHHPAGTVTDGAGLRLKLPAFIQTEKCWILPAFSPWAAGAVWPADASTQVWLCSPQRVLRLPQPTPVASA